MFCTDLSNESSITKYIAPTYQQNASGSRHHHENTAVFSCAATSHTVLAPKERRNERPSDAAAGVRVSRFSSYNSIVRILVQHLLGLTLASLQLWRTHSPF